jgi:hypothetical protein
MTMDIETFREQLRESLREHPEDWRSKGSGVRQHTKSGIYFYIEQRKGKNVNFISEDGVVIVSLLSDELLRFEKDRIRRDKEVRNAEVAQRRIKFLSSFEGFK